MTADKSADYAEKDKIKLSELCSKCRLPVRISRSGSMTNWMFRASSCNCDSGFKFEPEKAEFDGNSGAYKQPDIITAESNELPLLPDKYEVIGFLGRGGMGSVYKVRDKELDLVIAMKILDRAPIEDKEAFKRFEREAKTAKKLTHPNIGQVFEYSRNEIGKPYFTMEFIDGMSLASKISEQGSFSEEQVINVFKQIAEALAYSHSKGVIHRDIKPSNVLIVENDNIEPIARLIDFGIARALPTSSENRKTQDISKTGDAFGTPTYMSPEQCMGFKLDERSDIYSFGALMYEMLTGAPPHTAENPIQLVVKQMKENALSWSGTKDGEFYFGIEGVVLRCLEKDNRERYQNAEDLLADLEALSNGEKPAQFKRKVSAKSILSSGQLTKLLAEISLLVTYAVSLIVLKAWFLVAVLVPLVPVAIVQLIGQIFKTGGANLALKRWSVVAQISWLVTCLSAVAMVLAYFGAFESYGPTGQFFILSFIYAHWFFIIVTISALVGKLLFSGKNKLSTKRVFVTSLVSMSLIMLLSAPLMSPSKISDDLEVAPVPLTNLRAANARLDMSLGNENAESYRAIVRSYIKSNELQEARKYLQKAQAVKPIRASDCFENAELCISLNLDKEAQKLVSRGLKMEPTSEQGFSLQGELYLRSGRYEDALKAFDRSIELLPDQSGAVYEHRAAAMVRLGDPQGAIKDMSTVIGMRNSGRVKDYLLRALLYEKLGDVENARADYKEVVKRIDLTETDKSPLKILRSIISQISPLSQDRELLSFRAFAYSKLGEKQLAQSDLRTVQSKGGGKDDLLKGFQKLSGLSLDWFKLDESRGD